VRDDIVQLLQETLSFLSDDHWRFSFRPRERTGRPRGSSTSARTARSGRAASSCSRAGWIRSPVPWRN
jgi:hypothetical protein